MASTANNQPPNNGFYSNKNPQQAQPQVNPYLQNQGAQGTNNQVALASARSNPDQQVGVVDMKGDMQNVMAQFGPDLQTNLQQQLAQYAINKVFKAEEEKKKNAKMAQEVGAAGGGDTEESCGSLLFHRCCFFLDIDFYAPYFKGVTTEAVLKRIGYSLIPCKADFFSVADTQPDMYGPLWICFTLIFALTAAGNLALYIQSHDKAHFTYKFSFVSTAFSMVFGYALIVPIFIAFMMRLFGSHQTFYLKTMCIYGYSLFIFIPVSLLCAIPNMYLQYGLFFYAALNSMVFLINNFYSKLNELETQEGQTSRKKIVILLIAGIQALLMILYKYYFFKSISVPTTSELYDDIGTLNPFEQSHGHLGNSTLSYNGTLFKELHPHLLSNHTSMMPNGLF